jgi:hypothetical protein
MAPRGVEVEVAEGRSVVGAGRGRGEVGAGANPLASAPL